MKYKMIYFDGSSGWRSGGTVEPERRGKTLVVQDEDGEQEFFSRNNDGVYEDKEEGMTLLIEVE